MVAPIAAVGRNFFSRRWSFRPDANRRLRKPGARTNQAQVRELGESRMLRSAVNCPSYAGSGRSHFRLLGWGRTDPSPSRRYQRESAMRRQPDLLPSNRKRVPGEGVVADSPLGLRQGRWKRMNSSLKPGGMVPLSSCSTECLTPAAYPPSGREAASCRSAGSPKETRRIGDDTRLRSGQALKTPSGRECPLP